MRFTHTIIADDLDEQGRGQSRSSVVAGHSEVTQHEVGRLLLTLAQQLLCGPNGRYATEEEKALEVKRLRVVETNPAAWYSPSGGPEGGPWFLCAECHEEGMEGFTAMPEGLEAVACSACLREGEDGEES